MGAVAGGERGAERARLVSLPYWGEAGVSAGKLGACVVALDHFIRAVSSQVTMPHQQSPAQQSPAQQPHIRSPQIICDPEPQGIQSLSQSQRRGQRPGQSQNRSQSQRQTQRGVQRVVSQKVTQIVQAICAKRTGERQVAACLDSWAHELAEVDAHNVLRQLASLKQNARQVEAFDWLLHEGRRRGLTASVRLYGAAINACGRCQDWATAQRFIADLEASGKQPTLHLYHAIVSACGRCARWREAHRHYKQMTGRDHIRPDQRMFAELAMGFYHASDERHMAGLLCEIKDLGMTVPEDVFRLAASVFHQKRDVANLVTLDRHMAEQGAAADDDIGCKLIAAHGQIGNIGRAEAIYQDLRRRGLARTRVVYNELVVTLVKAGRTEDAERVLRDLLGSGLAPSVVPFNALMESYVADGQMERAEGLLQEMRRHGVSPSAATCRLLVTAYMREGQLDRALSAVDELRSRGVAITEPVYSALLDGHVAAGEVGAARDVLVSMRAAGGAPPTYMYNRLMGMYARMGDCEKAAALHRVMQDRGLAANEVTHALLLQAYSRADSWPAASLLTQAISRSAAHSGDNATSTHQQAASATAAYSVPTPAAAGPPTARVLTAVISGEREQEEQEDEEGGKRKGRGKVSGRGREDGKGKVYSALLAAFGSCHVADPQRPEILRCMSSCKPSVHTLTMQVLGSSHEPGELGPLPGGSNPGLPGTTVADNSTKGQVACIPPTVTGVPPHRVTGVQYLSARQGHLQGSGGEERGNWGADVLSVPPAERIQEADRAAAGGSGQHPGEAPRVWQADLREMIEHPAKGRLGFGARAGMEAYLIALTHALANMGRDDVAVQVAVLALQTGAVRRLVRGGPGGDADGEWALEASQMLPGAAFAFASAWLAAVAQEAACASGSGVPPAACIVTRRHLFLENRERPGGARAAAAATGARAVAAGSVLTGGKRRVLGSARLEPRGEGEGHLSAAGGSTAAGELLASSRAPSSPACDDLDPLLRRNEAGAGRRFTHSTPVGQAVHVALSQAGARYHWRRGDHMEAAVIEKEWLLGLVQKN
eukprot:jgi/Mesen1/6279/ME000324S05316